MASLIRMGAMRSFQRREAVKLAAMAINSKRELCGLVRDFMPGPRPQTAEEYARAARKYNMIPEDYEPGPEEEGYGDYPLLPAIGPDGRDPYGDQYGDYDYGTWKRNYGETVHYFYDAMTQERHDPTCFERDRHTQWTQFSIFLAFYSVFWTWIYFFDYYDLRQCHPHKPKQWPDENGKSGLVHYTFEPLD